MAKKKIKNLDKKIKKVPKSDKQKPEKKEVAEAGNTIEIDFLMSSMVSITLLNGTRISFAENTSYEQANFDIETFKQILNDRKGESLKISR